MTAEEKKEMERLRNEVDRLMAINVNLATATEQLVERNVDLYERLDRFYNVRMRVDWLKDLVRRHREMMANADLRNDDELLAMVEPEDLHRFGLIPEFVGRIPIITHTKELDARDMVRTLLKPASWATASML